MLCHFRAVLPTVLLTQVRLTGLPSAQCGDHPRELLGVRRQRFHAPHQRGQLPEAGHLGVGRRGDAFQQDGPVGVAFANALAQQSMGHSNLLAVLEPNLAVKPSTVMITKVTIKGAKQAVQMFGPAQRAVAMAVADCVAEGTIPQDEAENLFICVGVFIHWEAADDHKIQQYNYEATKLSIERAVRGEPTAATMISKKDSSHHPFQAA